VIARQGFGNQRGGQQGMRFLFTLLAVLVATVAGPRSVDAHPHVWVTVKATVLYDDKGQVTGVRHAWTFDEMFSAFAVQGLDTNNDKAYSREELASLAEVNVTSLKEFDYFTFGKADGKAAAFRDPEDYFLDFNAGSLTLTFTLPLKTPARGKAFDVDVYDSTFFVSFELAKTDAATMRGNPPGCQITAKGPKPVDDQKMSRLGEDFFSSLTANSDFGAQFANKIAVKCP
jgi:ABC-type uncharacterized transport system substrate-binding protein